MLKSLRQHHINATQPWSIWLLALFLSWPMVGFSQSTVITGKVLSKSDGKPIPGVNIRIQNTDIGTITNPDGLFEIEIAQKLPQTLIFSFVGMKNQNIVVNENLVSLNVTLEEEVVLGEEVVVSATRTEESILRSPVSIEKMSIIDIEQISAPNFYDGLKNLKGVDMSVHSLIFKLPNTRGFNGNTNYRMNQFVDGVDNTAPGLSFAAGNIFGLSSLDVESVELLVGASSALYGPGGMNGTLLMTSKNPWDYQGISASVQTGVMHAGADYKDNPGPMTDVNLRYAKALNDKWAIKVTAGYLAAEDWHASDFRDRTNLEDPSLNRNSNPGYDGVNVYGDDIIVPVNLSEIAPDVADGVARAQGYEPGDPEYDDIYGSVIDIMPDQVISRTGFEEQHLVDYGTRNFKIGTSIHHKFNENLEGIIQGNYSNGTSVYTAQNRFSLNNFSIFSGKMELNGDNFNLRTYGMIESSGDTYDAGATGLLINEAWKPSEDWYADYIEFFVQTALLGGTEVDAHRFARLVADNRTENFGPVFNPALPAIPIPGSVEFERFKNDIIKVPVNDGGSRVVDQSKLWHIEGMYNLSDKIKLFELLIGGNYRIYVIDSDGTIFFDTPGNPVVIHEYGAFMQIAKPILNNRVKFTASARYDNNENFSGQFTPRFSFVAAIDAEGNRNIRGSYQTAFRFPAIADQLVDLNTGPYQVIGGLPEIHRSYNFDTNPVYPLAGQNPIVDDPILDNGPFQIPPFVAEKVASFELGYRGLHLHKSILLEASVYQNKYENFMAQQNLVQNPNTPEEQRFQTTISTQNPVTAYGWSAGMDWYLPGGYMLKGNVNYNTLKDENSELFGYQSAFNTPDYRFNVSVGNRNFGNNMGFNVSFRWQNEFTWESTFAVGRVPAFSTFDAHVSYDFENLKSSLKVGGSNVLNQYYTTNIGSGQLGGLYYVTWTFDSVFN